MRNSTKKALAAALVALVVAAPAAADGGEGAGKVLAGVLARAREAGVLTRVTGLRAFTMTGGGLKEDVVLVLRGADDGQTFRLTGRFGGGGAFRYDLGPDGKPTLYAAEAAGDDETPAESLRGGPAKGGFRIVRTTGGERQEMPHDVADPIPDMVAMFVLPALADQALPDLLEHRTLTWGGAIFSQPSTLSVDRRGEAGWTLTYAQRRRPAIKVEVGGAGEALGRILKVTQVDRGEVVSTTTPLAAPPAAAVKALEADEERLAKR